MRKTVNCSSLIPLITKKSIIYDFMIIIIIRLLMSPLLGHRPVLINTRRTGHNPPLGPSADWWVLTTANAAGTNT
jgi:hypothetical protein